VQAALGSDAVFHQVQAACPGFLDALMVADSLMANIGYRRALVLAGDKMTHIVDKRDFRMIGLFADAAGGVVLEDVPLEGPYGLQGFYAGSCGSKGHVLRVPAGGSRRPITAERLAAGENYLISEFREVYAFAVETTTRCVNEACRRARLRVDEVSWLIPHHASKNIILDSLKLSGIPHEKVVMSIEHTGNTSSGSVPTALDEAARAGRFRTGDNLLLLALGAGLGWGSTIYRWVDPAVARGARR
jgi:3-oxoacyl-[acyl-carrier-protein] synthase-3